MSIVEAQKPRIAPTACVDGNEAAASVAYALSEVIAIYPITPASPMGEHADTWAAEGRTNLWGSVPEVVEMQSRGGRCGHAPRCAPGWLDGDHVHRLAGTVADAAEHVQDRRRAHAGRDPCRGPRRATHALSIFGDHSDVMAARSTGFAMLASSSVQEAHDFALVAHAATLRSRVPFLHFFDGFRTSHEINMIELLTDDDLRALVGDDEIAEHKMRRLRPTSPVIRGTAQNPDVFFQGREAANRYHDAVPGDRGRAVRSGRTTHGAAATAWSTTRVRPMPNGSS